MSGSQALAYLGALAQQDGAVAVELRSDDDGLAPLSAGLLAQIRQHTALIYAVDQAGGRAGISLLDLQDYVDANPQEPPAPIDVTLEPAARVKVAVSLADAKEVRVEPRQIYLMLTRDGLPLQQAVLAELGMWEALLPAGRYKLAVYSPGFAETMSEEFQIAAGAKLHALYIPLRPARLARLVGQPAPEFQQIKRLPEGPAVRLADLKGKVVVLDFWGYGCGPCIAAMPNLMDLHQEFHPRGVAFLAIHDDSVASVEELRRIVAKLQAEQWNGRGLLFPVLLDGGGETLIPGSETKTRGATTAAYEITSFPTTLVLDRAGRVHGQISVHDLDAARRTLNELLSAPAP